MNVYLGKAKPYTDKKGRKGSAERYVSNQPLKFQNQYNLRKLNQLPFHLIRAGALELFKKEVLCNFEFLLARIKSSGLRPLLTDLKAAQMEFEKDHDIFIVLEALQVFH